HPERRAHRDRARHLGAVGAPDRDGDLAVLIVVAGGVAAAGALVEELAVPERAARPAERRTTGREEHRREADREARVHFASVTSAGISPSKLSFTVTEIRAEPGLFPKITNERSSVDGPRPRTSGLLLSRRTVVSSSIGSLPAIGVAMKPMARPSVIR